ncbi:dephospho-CoA kinase [Georgenia sp. Z1344]|uniref:dephospho-CoA kinase n=1 Tax=Georgenia sp. Z1344 TaxID=3416706 RepID=UPI003CF9EA58
MLSVGLTGGIAAGKSTVAAELVRLGAVVVDADVLARQVVEPGTPGLAAIAREWGSGMLRADGSLDREALGAVVFADPAALRRLGEITHPLVLAEHERLEREAVDADPGAIVVHDVPLIVENDVAHRYHLVLVVHAPEGLRVRRMVEHRGMTAEQARARVAAQATDEQRRAVADVWLDNTGSEDELVADVRRAWHGRLRPYEENVRTGTVAERSGGPVLREPGELADLAGAAAPVELTSTGSPTERGDHREHGDPAELDTGGGTTVGRLWASTGARLVARLGAALEQAGVAADVSHIGSTAVPGLAAKDVLDLQVGVDDLGDDRVPDVLARAGFPTRQADGWDHPHPPADDRPWPKRFHRNADPGRAVNLHVRETGSPGWRWALAFRDALRDDPDVRSDYATMKRAMARSHADDPRTGGYAEAKEPWFDLHGSAIVTERLATHPVEPDLDLRDPDAA